MGAPVETPLIAINASPFVLEPKVSTSDEKDAIALAELPLSPARIYQIIKTFFGAMAAVTETTSPARAA